MAFMGGKPNGRGMNIFLECAPAAACAGDADVREHGTHQTQACRTSQKRPAQDTSKILAHISLPF
jgi:hypothetical protein